MHITVTRSYRPLETTEYMFYLLSSHFKLDLILDRYVVSERPSKRHGWKSKFRYDRTDNRHGNIAVADIEIPQDVADEAKGLLFEQIKVTK